MTATVSQRATPAWKVQTGTGEGLTDFPVPLLPEPQIRERIIAAANQLFEQAGRAQFPAVDAVRRLARANMGDTSAVMKEWRRAQTAQAAPVGVVSPALLI
ncbi:DNA-binding protein [Xanthomonas vasicola]|uniref:DNA-binding protein n=1 Tax=Xanthomonas vasicola TaxID=56459 RepID=UPI003CCCEB76